MLPKSASSAPVSPDGVNSRRKARSEVRPAKEGRGPKPALSSFSILTTASFAGSNACGEEGSDLGRKTQVKPASAKQEVSGRFAQQ